MAHCTGCGLWLSETELFCGICGLERAGTDPRHRVAHVTDGDSSRLTQWVSFDAEQIDWRRALDYVATVMLWVLLVCVLGAMFEGAAAFVAVALGSLGIAVAIRWFYAWTGNRSFLSPWLFALAAVFAFLSVIGQATRESDTTAARAVHRGISTSEASATPFELQTSGCVKALMLGIRNLPASKRAFSLPDSRIFANRYCEEAVRMGLVGGASTGSKRQAITALQAKVVNQLVGSGKIKLLP